MIIAETIISAVTGMGILCLIIAETIISAVTRMGILCLIIAETIISAVTGLLVTCICNKTCFRRTSLLCQLILDVKKAKVI